MKRILTNRLLIRPMELQDLYEVHEILKDEETMRFFVEGTYSVTKVKEIVNRNQKETRHFVVCLRSSNRVVGKISYHDWFMRETKEIGWIFNRNATGNGYCTEAAKAVVDYAFKNEGIHRIIATCQPENIASKRICEKLGMKLEGHFEKSIYYKDDIWWDELHYGLLRDVYLKKKEGRE